MGHAEVQHIAVATNHNTPQEAIFRLPLSRASKERSRREVDRYRHVLLRLRCRCILLEGGSYVHEFEIALKHLRGLCDVM